MDEDEPRKDKRAAALAGWRPPQDCCGRWSRTASRV